LLRMTPPQTSLFLPQIRKKGKKRKGRGGKKKKKGEQVVAAAEKHDNDDLHLTFIPRRRFFGKKKRKKEKKKKRGKGKRRSEGKRPSPAVSSGSIPHAPRQRSLFETGKKGGKGRKGKDGRPGPRAMFPQHPSMILPFTSDRFLVPADHSKLREKKKRGRKRKGNIWEESTTVAQHSSWNLIEPQGPWKKKKGKKGRGKANPRWLPRSAAAATWTCMTV